jgi:hypothetical protein
VSRIALLSSLVLVGCGSAAVPKQAPGRPPTPATVSVAEPGGDAHDPQEAALLRQLREPWGRRNDKDDQLHVPTPDWEHWKRVRYWGFDHFSGWRYGDDAHVVAVAVLLDVKPGEEHTSERCLRRFDAMARPRAERVGVKLVQSHVVSKKWRDRLVLVEVADGYADTAFSRKHYSAAWGAYTAYPDACLVYAVAVAWGEHEALAKQVRDRWVDEAFSQMTPLTPTRPYRKP